jgi:DNA primase
LYKGIPVDEIKASVNIEEIVEEYTELKKVSQGYKGLCPFHDDSRTWSLSVIPRGIYKGKPTDGFFLCFSPACNLKGDVITFVQYAEDVEFKEACKILAEKVGIEYTEKTYSKKEVTHLKILRERTIRYMKSLQSDEMALQYIYDRGLTDDDIKHWRIGLVPMDEHKRRPDETWLKDRYSFPLLVGGKEPFAVAMGYRMRNPQPNDDKYIYDTVSYCPTYEGSKNLLFGLPYARKAIRKKKYAILVEGYFDVISMHKSGFTNTVGSFGCKPTEEQRTILKNMTDTILLWYDGDLAGLTSIRKYLPDLIKDGFNVSVIVVPNGQDPDEFVKSVNYDSEKIKKFISLNAVPGIKFLLDHIVDKYERQVLKFRANALKQIKPILSIIPDDIEKQMYEKLFYKKLDI